MCLRELRASPGSLWVSGKHSFDHRHFKLPKVQQLRNHHHRHHQLLPPWIKSFDLFRHRRSALVSWGDGLGLLTCSGIDALPSFPGASTVSSSSRFVFEGVFRESGVVHSFKVIDPVLLVFECHVLYSRDL